MNTYSQLEPPLTSAERPANAGHTARRPLYHPASIKRLGRVLRGRYRLESLLGMGAMGEVYRAVDLQLEQPCAVKLVFPGAVFSLHAHRRFVNEARVVARLFHPNIVEVRDFNEDADGTKFLVMELLEGQDLHELLSHKGKLPLLRAIEIVRSVGAALQYAHDMGIVHRDVKPNNIFLSGRAWRDGRAPRELGDGDGEQVKVLDFGLAKLLTDPARAEPGDGDSGSGATAQLTQGIIIGTPAYLSPEATAMDSSGVDARSDQWSLAVVAYQLLSGRLPFGNPNPYRLCQMICSEEPVRLRTLVPTLPEHIDAAIHTALSKQREDRFPKVLEFIRSLGNLPSLGGVDKDRGLGRGTPTGRYGSIDPLSPPPGPVASSGAADGACQATRAATEFSEPTQIDPYLPGLTRPRLALLPPGKRGQGSVPEFVEPDRELCSLRVSAPAPAADSRPASARPADERPDPDLLVTAHYTAEQLVELSQLAAARELDALVQPAQDGPTAPYRFGTRSARQIEEEYGRTPLPVPLPLLSESSLPVTRVAAPAPETAEPLPPIPEPKALTETLVPGSERSLRSAAAPSGPIVAAPPAASRTPVPAAKPVGRLGRGATPPKPPKEAFGEPGQLQTLLLGPRAAATFAAFAGKDTAGQTFQTMHVVQRESLGPTAAPRATLVVQNLNPSPLDEPQQLNSTMLQLQMPPLLTLNGTRPPELGVPLLFTPPPRRRLWRAVGAGSVVLGLVVAVLLGLRLVRTKAVSVGTGALPRQAARAAPRIPTGPIQPVPVAYALTEDPYPSSFQSLQRGQPESVASPSPLATPEAGSSPPPQ